MVSEREYLLLSVLAYLNFERKHIGREIVEILENHQIKTEEGSNVKILRTSNLPITINYFREELEGWRVLHIENRRAQSKSIFNKGDKSGFFSISFEKKGKIVISFRGSETFPIEEAYKDFVENNFALGIGKRPKQFNDAAYTVDYHLKNLEIDIEAISLTGHSLGGGLAQFAALYTNKTYGIIPFTSTWNAVGINKIGVIQIQDFINFDEILEKKMQCSKKVVEALKPFRDEYLKILEGFDPSKNIKLVTYLETNSRVRMILEGIVRKIYLTPHERTEFMLKIIDNFFMEESLLEEVGRGKKFIEEIHENTIYMGKVRNFGHSKDLTNCIFNHVGELHQVDIGSILKRNEGTSMVKTIFTMKKAITNYHFEDVFIPYMRDRGEGEDVFANKLHPDFISSALRRYLYEEKGFKIEVLAEFYSNIEIDENNYKSMEKQLIEGIKRSEINIVYQESICASLEEMGLEEFRDIWKRTYSKLPSPFIKIDIFDVLVY